MFSFTFFVFIVSVLIIDLIECLNRPQWCTRCLEDITEVKVGKRHFDTGADSAGFILRCSIVRLLQMKMLHKICASTANTSHIPHQLRLCYQIGLI